jgi:hypothetical protein
MLLGAVLASIFAAVAFAAMQVLPRTTARVTLGERLAESISSIPAVRSVERVGPHLVVRTDCRRLSGQVYLLTLPPRRHFLIDGATLTPLETRWHEGQTLGVEVALSGCPSLLMRLLERLVLPAFQLRRGLPIQATTWRHRHVYRVALTSKLELLVDRRTLTPVALQLTLRWSRSTSVLAPAPARNPSR